LAISPASRSRPFEKPNKGRFAVKVINRLSDEIKNVFRVMPGYNPLGLVHVWLVL